MCRSATRSINSLLKQIAKHRQKLKSFSENPTVRPGMEGQPPEVIASQQADRINHLLDEINTFAENINKVIQGIL